MTSMNNIVPRISASGRANYFVLSLISKGVQDSTLHYLIEKGELFLTPNVRLGYEKMAHISSVELAEHYREACLPILKRRYGPNTKIEIEEVTADATQKLLKRIDRDSNLIQARLDSNNLSPNKPPRTRE